MPSEIDRRLQEEVIRIAPTIPKDVFQFELSRREAEQHLANHPATPFIIRKSSQQGHYALTAHSQSSPTTSSPRTRKTNHENQERVVEESSRI